MLEIKNLFAGYGKSRVLNGLNLEVNRKEIVAVIGPNGSGKSTVLKSLFGLAKIFSGKIKFTDNSLEKLNTHELIRLGIGYIPQGEVAFDDLTVTENLQIGGKFLNDKKIVNSRVKQILERFPILKNKRNKFAYSLSGGERQLLAIGRILMIKPTLLLLDEPSIGLSPILQKELFKILKSLKDEGMSLLIVEQNAKKAIEIADRTYVLEEGNVALTGGKEIVNKKEIKEIYLGGKY